MIAPYKLCEYCKWHKARRCTKPDYEVCYAVPSKIPQFHEKKPRKKKRDKKK